MVLNYYRWALTHLVFKSIINTLLHSSKEIAATINCFHQMVGGYDSTHFQNLCTLNVACDVGIAAKDAFSSKWRITNSFMHASMAQFATSNLPSSTIYAVHKHASMAQFATPYPFTQTIKVDQW